MNDERTPERTEPYDGPFAYLDDPYALAERRGVVTARSPY